ncbi:MAG TPA: hypothetical protein PK186_11005 [candidate division Zixibacteria bacterium]|nr:hypothetical protein [candidate division Zixibacteria bacterium]MDD4917834.1 hypothetical protein [candidate division Zixibacteria bacterium]MDM7974190.1 hypothetical protein [candidate division Zixibacteria bacterium]HOD67588.1 hypothetical protein [candidate division Zixibacteria bacterium]HPM38072.1 hypothetical protein [candidate division Zixibacteria bacterium]
MTRRALLAILVLCAGACVGQEAPGDTAGVAPRDTAQVLDTAAARPADSALAPPADSLSAAERARQSFEERYRQHQEESMRAQRPPSFSPFDSLVDYFTSPRMNMRKAVDRSWYHDAGDYFRLDPSFFVLSHQVVPMRSTVAPFGLMNDRLNLIAYGHRLGPYEHIAEPDGMVDMNAVPTALDNDIFLLAGPVGKLFGGAGAIASLVTRPYRPADRKYHSAFLVNQGGFGYAHVRGRLSKLFSDGRTVDAAVEYRNADGVSPGRESDQYSYYGDFYFPLLGRTGLRTWGWLYDTEGPLAVRPDVGGASLERDRFNRTAEAMFTNDNEAGTRRYEFGYRHERHGLANTGRTAAPLKHRLNWTGHGGFLHGDWLAGRHLVSVSLDGSFLEYDSGGENIERLSGSFALRLADLSPGWRYALTAEIGVVENYPLLPGGTATVFRDGPHGMVLLAVGFAGRAPSLNELHLPARQSPLYGGSDLYAEEGDERLKRERQLVGSLVLELGTVRNNVNFAVTGGRIFDGIEWAPEPAAAALVFRPVNTTLDFVTATVTPRLSLGEFAAFRGGVSYHWLDYEKIEDRAYAPEYQAFSGLELHVAWPQRRLNLYAYGEVVYTGPYQGYVEQNLGEDPVFNGKLSFMLNDDYRMHFVFENVLSRAYSQRDYLVFPGRYFYLGFEWSFLD